jgi:drug/metabolite transporter (DMT)-like permease
MPQKIATLMGCCALILWASLAPLSVILSDLPTFEVMTIGFALAGFGGLSLLGLQGQLKGALFLPLKAWWLGVGGIFGYHSLYFLALRAGPVAEANLLNYLWPLWIVVLAALLLPGERLSARLLIGALLAFMGAGVLLVKSSPPQTIQGGEWVLGQWAVSEWGMGHNLALACAFVWGLYSVLSRRLPHVPSSAVFSFCAVTALLSLALGVFLEAESWRMPRWGEFLALLLSAIGPIGGAFWLWDRGCKYGQIRLLGVLSYATPLLSTALLIAMGKAPLDSRIALAAFLIVLGGFLAHKA